MAISDNNTIPIPQKEKRLSFFQPFPPLVDRKLVPEIGYDPMHFPYERNRLPLHHSGIDYILPYK